MLCHWEKSEINNYNNNNNDKNRPVRDNPVEYSWQPLTGRNFTITLI